MLKKNNINILKEIEYPDHYTYSDKDINNIITEAENINCKIITTEKDFYRLNNNSFSSQILPKTFQKPPQIPRQIP